MYTCIHLYVLYKYMQFVEYTNLNIHVHVFVQICTVYACTVHVCTSIFHTSTVNIYLWASNRSLSIHVVRFSLKKKRIKKTNNMYNIKVSNTTNDKVQCTCVEYTVHVTY